MSRINSVAEMKLVNMFDDKRYGYSRSMPYVWFYVGDDDDGYMQFSPRDLVQEAGVELRGMTLREVYNLALSHYGDKLGEIVIDGEPFICEHPLWEAVAKEHEENIARYRAGGLLNESTYKAWDAYMSHFKDLYLEKHPEKAWRLPD